MQNELLAEIVERLPEFPVFFIRAEDDPARWSSWRSAARGKYSRQTEPNALAGPGGAVAPEVLDLVEHAPDEPRRGRVKRSMILRPAQSGALVFMAVARRLTDEAGGVPACALLTIKDETDARRNERMRADFLANASRELRTPSGVPVGLISRPCASSPGMTPWQREKFFGVMAAQAERMSRSDCRFDEPFLHRAERTHPAVGRIGSCGGRSRCRRLAGAHRGRGGRHDRDAERARACAAGDRDQVGVQVALNLHRERDRYLPDPWWPGDGRVAAVLALLRRRAAIRI